MRTVTFTLRERMAVTPVEIWGARRWLLAAAANCRVAVHADLDAVIL